MRDYTHLYRDALTLNDDWGERWNLFLSAYNPSDRVTTVFQKITADEKHWLVHKEYNYLENQHPLGSVFLCDSNNEAEFVLDFFASKLPNVDLGTAKICVDLTGFMRPHIMFMMKYLAERGVKELDAIYSEPSYYAMQEHTEFSLGSVNDVRQVAGFEGTV